MYVPCNNRDELLASQNCRCKQLVSLQYRPWKSIFDLLIWSIYYNFSAAAQLTADEEFGGTALQETVDIAYRETSKRLLEIFFSKYKFLDHLRVRNVLRPFFNYFFSVVVVVLVVVVVSQRLYFLDQPLLIMCHNDKECFTSQIVHEILYVDFTFYSSGILFCPISEADDWVDSQSC